MVSGVLDGGTRDRLAYSARRICCRRGLSAPPARPLVFAAAAWVAARLGSAGAGHDHLRKFDGEAAAGYSTPAACRHRHSSCRLVRQCSLPAACHKQVNPWWGAALVVPAAATLKAALSRGGKPKEDNSAASRCGSFSWAVHMPWFELCCTQASSSGWH